MELNIQQIKAIIPHRYPFLLIDKITNLTDTTATGIKCVTANEEFFNGHFPEYPVMPGVLIVEALAQVGAVCLLSKDAYKGKIALFAGIDKLRFRQQVIPGDVLTLNVELTKIKGPIGVGKATATVNGKIAVSGEIMFAVQ